VIIRILKKVKGNKKMKSTFKKVTLKIETMPIYYFIILSISLFSGTLFYCVSASFVDKFFEKGVILPLKITAGTGILATTALVYAHYSNNRAVRAAKELANQDETSLNDKAKEEHVSRLNIYYSRALINHPIFGQFEDLHDRIPGFSQLGIDQQIAAAKEVINRLEENQFLRTPWALRWLLLSGGVSGIAFYLLRYLE
jgi:hypothetical protein